ncbi:amino acid adenylation domain-containing protein [Nostoc sphaeroides CHAB 2801]|uniref:non-ribosomal peptide synthetase n=1 Tax=Nostoc sphaeroides TaxID=446679 RepID=UPI001E39CE60|nr:non-ribosomal peptide synthetase [Nostoc sphaeroides]MCC5632732.1 amino acid adenylation domain-containing protein [Nostoc sphaeroides CHAB 2801]
MAQYVNDLEEITCKCSTVVELLRYRSIEQANTEAFTFLYDGEAQAATLTYQELDRHSRAIASQLQTLGLSGERALLLYPPGIDYLPAFFGCLYAGLVAVPAYPPRNQRNTPRILAILQDSQTAVILTTTAILAQLKSLLADKFDINNLLWLTTDNLTPGIEEDWQEPFINTDTLAFLQYTSGSTGTPKGVMVTHGNLLHNAEVTRQYMEHTSSSKFVTWLPVYHDMGLIGGVLQPLYSGFPCIMMPPAAFLQRPYRWLQAISRYRGTTSGAPNFAYELCIEKVTPEQRSTLDLSSWDVAFNGAEPIRQETLERFATTFAECGFRPEAFYPCYGMAETTLMVSGSVKSALVTTKLIYKNALERNHVIETVTNNDNNSIVLVGCGRSVPQQQVVIVNPESSTRCQDGEIGEIWVSGPSVGKGYWNRQAETEQTFHAFLQDTGEGPFLCTGDLGFLDNGEVFITGRAKDLIIIRGRNLYPQDIELTAERSHPSLRAGGNAAFCVEVDAQEQLVVVQELEFRAKPNLEEVAAAIRQGVAEEHEVQVYGVVLIKPGTIPKTSSGKIQRRATKAEFLAGELQIISSKITERINFVETENNLQLNRTTLLSLTPKESQLLLESYLLEQVARVLKITPMQIDSKQALSSLGFDSLRVFELKNLIESHLEVAVSVADFFEGLSIQGLATKILTEITEGDVPLITLTKVEKSTDYHPLSFSQQGLWFIHQLAPDTPAYNIPIVINLTGKINIAALKQSLSEIIQRHEVLRTKFVLVDGQPVQVINPTVSFSLPIEDLRDLSEDNAVVTAQSLTRELAQYQFDLSCQPLLCGLLLRLTDNEYRLLITFHHIVSDGWSVGVFIRELAALYDAFANGKLSPLPELPLQYVDFAYWQRKNLHPERIQTLLTYWKQRLGGKLPILDLPCDHPRRRGAACRKTSPLQTFNGAKIQLSLPKNLTDSLKQLSHQEGTTLFMTLLAAFKTLLYRYTGQTDILVGSPVANRNSVEVESLIGLFVNVLVLRTNLSEQPTFRELLARVKSTALEAYIHQDLPFDKLVEELQPERDLSHNPLFQVMFVLQNVAIATPKLSDVSLTFAEGDNGSAKFDLTLFMEDREQGLVATLEYNTDLFNTDTIHRMLGHFQTLLESVVSQLDTKIAELPLLTEVERHQLLIEWNDTKRDYPQNQCIHQLFEQQVEQTPDAIALIFGNQKLTYRELNERANKVAHYLKTLGVKPDVLVGICMERSLEMVIGILAIIKAGGAYVPLDPTYPKERLAFMLADAQVSVLLVQPHLVSELPPHQAQVVCIDSDAQEFAAYSLENPISKVTTENLAYVIYTSGSTGKPKGVQISHGAVVNFLMAMRQKPGLTQQDILLSVTTLSFDIAALEIYLPLTVGAQVVIVSRQEASDGIQLSKQLNSCGATVMQATPATWRMVLAAGWNGNQQLKILCGGEALDYTLAQKLQQRSKQVWNLYGPTETTIWSAVSQVQNTIAIGHPIANTQFYILDQYCQLVPIGVVGELHIGGAGLARGYLNKPELTQQKFISSPFESGKYLYKTGDLVRYRSDGNIEYLGRIDHQVKIRGFRIELGEIEAVLGQHSKVRETVVIAREDIPKNQRLVAYVVPHSEMTLHELRDYLKDKLPDYMVPSIFVELKTLPLSPNGKIDRHALPVPDIQRPDLKEAYEAPNSEVERAIAKIWLEILNLEKVGTVGTNDNFFDLGGNSLLMVQVNYKLREVLHSDISVVEMFQNPTIKSLAKYINISSKETSAFESLNNRIQKQIEAVNRQKSLMKRGRNLNK